MGTDLYIDCFGSISQKKRQGVLRVTSQETTYELTVFDGKIVSVHSETELPARGICDRLFAAGKLAEKVHQKVAGSRASISQLYDGLVGRNFVSHDDFMRAMTAYGVDVLHSLRSLQDPQFEFASGVIRPDARLVFSVHPGQLLLDLEELTGDDLRLRELFGGPEVPQKVRLRTSEMPRTLLGNEIAVWRAIGKGTTLSRLLSSHLLSYYDIVQALLALNDQGLIEICPADADDDDGAAGPSPEDDDSGDLAPMQIDETIDDVFARMAYDAVDSLLDGFEGTFGVVEELQSLPPESAANGTETASQPKPQKPAEPRPKPAASVAEPRRSEPPVRESRAVDSRATIMAPVEPEAEPDEPDEEKENVEESEHPASISERFDRFALLLLEPEHKVDLCIAVISVFFFLLAWWLPAQLEQWFQALRDYSSI